MDQNEENEQKRVVVDSPGVRREVVTERTQRGPEGSGPSAGTIALVVVFLIAAAGIIVYLINNRNDNEAANRNANIDALRQAQQPAPVIQQPAPQQAPVIVEQPVPAQQAPIIVQQPANTGSANDDATMQDVATKKLADDPDMASVSVSITNARAVLTGTVNSAATKAKAERVIKSVRGLKSVDNQIVIAS